MASERTVSAPYQPHWLHHIYEWVERLPLPAILFYLLLWLAYILASHIPHWLDQDIAFGQLIWVIAAQPVWMLESLFFGQLFTNTAKGALDEFKPLLGASEGEYQRLRFEFTQIPMRGGNIAVLVGFATGILVGAASAEATISAGGGVQTKLGLILSWSFALAVTLPWLYQLFRQMWWISRFYQRISQIDFYDLRPIYSFSRFTVAVALSLFVLTFVTTSLLNPGSFEDFSVIIFSVVMAGISLTVFYLPLAGVNRRLREEKLARIASVKLDLETVFAEHRRRVRADPAGDYSAMHETVETLKNESAILESIPTWPWSSGTLRNLLSAILLPLFLWLLQELLGRFLNF